MTCEVNETEINGAKYVCTQFPAKKAMMFKLKLAKVLGPAIMEILPALKELKSKDDNTQAKAVINAINKLFEAAEPEEMVDLIIDMTTTGHLKREGERVNGSSFDNLYSGSNLQEAYKAFFFVVRTNYAGFLKGQGDQLLAKVEDKL